MLCANITKGWDSTDKKIYNQILRQADKVVYISKQYTTGCMQARNRHLVDSSGVCLCCRTNPKSGTAYTVKYAQRKGLQVINLAA